MGPATLLGIDTPFHRWAAQNPSGSLDLLFLAVPVAALLTMALLVWRMAQYRRETAQRLALEHAVGRDAARLRALVTAVPDIVVRYDREGRYQEIFLSELVPLVSPPGELIGKLVCDVYPDQGPPIVAAIDRALATRRTQVIEFDLPASPSDIRRRQLRITATADNEVYAFISDVTDRWEREHELQESHAIFRGTLDGLPLSVAVAHTPIGSKSAHNSPRSWLMRAAARSTPWWSTRSTVGRGTSACRRMRSSGLARRASGSSASQRTSTFPPRPGN